MATLRTGAVLVLGTALAIAIAISTVLSKPKERTFELTYVAEVPAPAGAQKVDVWVPYPESDAYQRISDIRVSAPVKTEVTHDREYGNAILHLAAAPPTNGPLQVEMTFRVTRQEHVARLAEGGRSGKREKPEALRRWLAADRFVPLDDSVTALARQVTAGKQTDLEKARAIYDYVVSTMSYDKSGTGWGRGDIHFACDARRGNCTDFHALFIGLARASGIPARFEIGFPLPDQRGAAEIAGYHCWAEFYLDDRGWVPVDASEAKKHPEKREYFFGAHCENRVQLSVGRDLVLSPPQASEPLNYFVYPYAEADGKPIPDVKKHVSFRDLDREAASRPGS